jgi:hypothetical protein
VLPVCGSVFGRSNVIAGIDYAFDSVKTFPRSLHSLDGGFDGPCESFFDSLSLQGLAAGLHKLYLQARTASGAVSIDSIDFSISHSGSIKRTGAAKGASGWSISESKTGGRIRLIFSSPLPTAITAPMSARIISSNGICVKELACKRKGGIVVEWAGENALKEKAAPGVYYLVVSSGRRIIYRTTLVISK